MEHTKEPWIFNKENNGGGISRHAYNGVYSEDGSSSRTIADFDIADAGKGDIGLSNAKRAVACVNALAGIKDPEAFVKAAKIGKEAADKALFESRDGEEIGSVAEGMLNDFIEAYKKSFG